MGISKMSKMLPAAIAAAAVTPVTEAPARPAGRRNIMAKKSTFVKGAVMAAIIATNAILPHIVMAAALTAMSCQNPNAPEIEKEEEFPDWNQLEKIDTNKSGKTDIELLYQLREKENACIEPDLNATIQCIADEMKDPDYASREITVKIATRIVDGERVILDRGTVMGHYADGNHQSQTAFRKADITGDDWKIEEFKVSKLELGRDPRYAADGLQRNYNGESAFFMQQTPEGPRPVEYGESNIISTFNH